MGRWILAALKVRQSGQGDMKVCFTFYIDIILNIVHRLHNANEALRCRCLRWDAENRHEHTILPLVAAPGERSVTSGNGMIHI